MKPRKEKRVCLFVLSLNTFIECRLCAKRDAQNIAAVGSLQRSSRRARQPDNCQGTARPKEQSRPSWHPTFQYNLTIFPPTPSWFRPQPQGVGRVRFSPPRLKSWMLWGRGGEMPAVFRAKCSFAFHTHPMLPWEVCAESSFLVSFF